MHGNEITNSLDEIWRAIEKDKDNLPTSLTMLYLTLCFFALEKKLI